MGKTVDRREMKRRKYRKIRLFALSTITIRVRRWGPFGNRAGERKYLMRCRDGLITSKRLEASGGGFPRGRSCHSAPPLARLDGFPRGRLVVAHRSRSPPRRASARDAVSPRGSRARSPRARFLGSLDPGVLRDSRLGGGSLVDGRARVRRDDRARVHPLPRPERRRDPRHRRGREAGAHRPPPRRLRRGSTPARGPRGRARSRLRRRLAPRGPLRRRGRRGGARAHGRRRPRGPCRRARRRRHRDGQGVHVGPRHLRQRAPLPSLDGGHVRVHAHRVPRSRRSRPPRRPSTGSGAGSPWPPARYSRSSARSPRAFEDRRAPRRTSNSARTRRRRKTQNPPPSPSRPVARRSVCAASPSPPTPRSGSCSAWGSSSRGWSARRRWPGS